MNFPTHFLKYDQFFEIRFWKVKSGHGKLMQGAEIRVAFSFKRFYFKKTFKAL